MINRELVEIVEVDWRQGTIMLCARVLLSAIFLVSAFSRVMDWDGSVLFLISHGMGSFAAPMCLLSLGFELFCGMSLLLGFKTRIGAYAGVVFLLAVAVTGHIFQLYSSEAYALQLSMFMKDLAIMGGLMMVSCFGAGPLSVDDANERIETIASLQKVSEQEMRAASL
ncbi:MAG TPA: DoxX family protein [Drouetiella sp.]